MRPYPDTARVDDTAPTVAVIITNFNYGHFLAGCIDCVLAQTARPDEIIVVDDGSTDGSAAVLSDYVDRVQVVRQPNGGQAAAFNTGFARSTGSIVLFLDADDLLRPEAIETVLTWWRPGLTSLSFWLELIDVEGRSRGIYEETLRVDDGDKRQRLIARGVFAFAPTSGNAFGRSFLESFLPLDEARWRISADLPLTYAAALHGPHIVIPQTLGAYRTHGGNSYYRERLPDAWRLNRGMRDVVDALTFLADRRQQRGRADLDEALLGLALRWSALRMLIKLQRLESDRGDLAAQARHACRRILSSGLPLGLRLFAALPFAALAGGWRLPWLRRWIADPRVRPAIIESAAASARRRRPEAPLARYAALRRPRSPPALAFAMVHVPDFNGLAASIMADGWSGEMSETLHWSRGPEADLEFRLDPHPHAIRLELSLVLGPALKGVTVAIETTLAARRLTIDHLVDQGVINVDLSRELLDASPLLRLRLACSVTAPARPGWRAALKPPPIFAIRSFRVLALDLPPSFTLLEPGSRHPFGRLLIPDPTETDWHVDADGVAWMMQSEAKAHVAVAPFPHPVALVLTLAASEARGRLRITAGDRLLFSGMAASGADLTCVLPPTASPDDTALDLEIGFTAQDPTDLAKVGIATIGLATVGETTTSRPPGTDRRLRLNIGERIALDPRAARRFARGRGWDIDGTSGLTTLETEASFTLGIPPDCLGPVLHLWLEPLLPEAEGYHHIVAVSGGRKMLVSARLQGIGSLDVPVPAQEVGPDGALTLTLHSLVVAQPAEDTEAAMPGYAGVRMRAVSLSARAPGHAALPARGHRYTGSRLHDLAREARAVVGGLRLCGRDALRQLRERFAIALWSTDRRGLESHLMVPGFLDDLDRLGALAAPLPWSPAEASLAVEVQGAPRETGALLRHMLCSMMLRCRPSHPGWPDLRQWPEPLLWSPQPLARFLAQISRSRRPGDMGQEWASCARTLLTHVLDTLRHEPRASVRYRLAVGILENLDPDLCAAPSMQDDPGPRLWARCVELHLARSGCRLPASAPPRPPRGRPRVGVLIREAGPGSEMGVALGICQAIDRDAFEPVLITLSAAPRRIDMGEVCDGLVELMEGTVERGAATIRQLDLDGLLIAAPSRGLDTITALVAHRLAPVQMVVPEVPGLCVALRSLAGRSPSERGSPSPDGAIMPLPCLDAIGFAARAWPTAPARQAQRPEPSPPLLVANAEDLDDHPALATLWLRVLAACPDCELVVETGPSPADREPEATLARGLMGVECAEQSIAPGRVRFLERGVADDEGSGGPDLALGFLGRSGGRLLDAVASGIPFVALVDPDAAFPGAEAWAACLVAAGLVTVSPEAYVRAAIDLVRDPSRREQRWDAIAQALDASDCEIDTAVATAFNAALRRIVMDRPPHG